MNNLEVAMAGVKIVAKILDFPAPELYIMEQSNLPNQEVTGMYRFKENEIIFNEDWVLRSNWTEVIITTFHEMRHAYQGYCIRTRSREAEEVLDIWEYETNNYIMPSGKNNELDDLTYLSQEIEIDAIAFAHWLVKSHLNIRTVVPFNIKEQVSRKITELGEIRL